MTKNDQKPRSALGYTVYYGLLHRSIETEQY